MVSQQVVAWLRVVALRQLELSGLIVFVQVPQASDQAQIAVWPGLAGLEVLLRCDSEHWAWSVEQKGSLERAPVSLRWVSPVGMPQPLVC